MKFKELIEKMPDALNHPENVRVFLGEGGREEGYILSEFGPKSKKRLMSRKVTSIRSRLVVKDQADPLSVALVYEITVWKFAV
jgi:hypothetical protein